MFSTVATLPDSGSQLKKPDSAESGFLENHFGSGDYSALPLIVAVAAVPEVVSEFGFREAT